MSQNNIPVSETYWSLVDKADKKFSKIRDLPYYERNRYDTYFYKVFKVYTQLWKFQQENRQKLLEAGLKRWEIGDIASRIGQLYFGQYMRTSDASYLSESYVFYEAVLTREYFKDGLLQDLNLANKQLRFLARFMMVCLVLNRREMVYQLVNQLKMLVDECKRTFQETDFKEWKLVVQEIVKFLKADTAFMNIFPLRYSLVLDLHPDCLPQVAAARRKLRLRDAILSSYYPNEVKFSELTLDTFRMLQCLEWEPSGSFYQSGGIPSGGTGTNTAQNGAPGPSRINYSQDIADPTLPPNPRKAVLYRPTVTQFVAVLATMCEELPPDGLLLIYLSASGSNISGSPNHSPVQGKGDSLSYRTGGGLHIGARGNGGVDSIYPCDFVPFTRKPLFIVVDSDNSKAFKAGFLPLTFSSFVVAILVVAINGVEKGEPAAMLLSPNSYPTVPSAVDSSRHPSGSLFTSFLTAPLQAFCLLLGISGPDVDTDMCNKAGGLLSSLLNDWGSMLAASDTLDPVWAQGLSDPFLRRLLLRFMFCRAVLTLYAPTFDKEEFLPECIPCLPEAFLPTAATFQTAVLQIANIFGATNRFVLSEGISLPESSEDEMSSS
ncbi:hypothetical protein RHGRI_001246 [Rhododendron griersonianum]|uniref:Protein SCAI n=1 Tax=Rhododendron griersonianum TaxID=479676 RepID=A0AAV6LN37_9ERIC|nr:hypothetical protein RHGRI_001246 [Rhododendron griersonianum]